MILPCHYRVLIPVTTFYPWGNVVPLRKDFQSILGISVYTLFIPHLSSLRSSLTSCAASLFALSLIDKKRMRYLFVLYFQCLVLIVTLAV